MVKRICCEKVDAKIFCIERVKKRGRENYLVRENILVKIFRDIKILSRYFVKVGKIIPKVS